MPPCDPGIHKALVILLIVALSLNLLVASLLLFKTWKKCKHFGQYMRIRFGRRNPPDTPLGEVSPPATPNNSRHNTPSGIPVLFLNNRYLGPDLEIDNEQIILGATTNERVV